LRLTGFQSFLTFSDWLDNSDPQLRETAVLSLGNMSCNVDHSKQLVETYQIDQKLISMLQIVEKNIRLAVLSTLKNLAVSPVTRSKLISEGLLDACLPFIGQLSIVMDQKTIFKLIGVMRLCTNGHSEVAKRIGGDRNVLESLIGWGNVESIAISSEIRRLLAAIIKNAKCKETSMNVVESGGLALVTAMLVESQNQPLMLNEAVLACTLVAATIDSEVVRAHLHTDLIINGIKTCLRSPSTPLEIKINSITLSTTLLKSNKESLTSQMRDLNFSEEALTEEALGETLAGSADVVQLIKDLQGSNQN